MPAIYITQADNTQQKFRLPEEEGALVTLGRNEDCTIPLPEVEGMSGLHCTIYRAGGVYGIRDEGSSNGTLMDGRAVADEQLVEGVAYAIGAAYLQYDAEATPAEEPLAEPIPVSEYADYSAPVAEEAAPVAAPAAPVRKKRKTASPLAAGKGVPRVKLQKKNETMEAINWLYVIIVLAISFYAGMTLRHWMEFGTFMPDDSPAKASKAVKKL